MDEDLARALAASRSEHADELEEDRQLREAIRLSMENEPEPSKKFEDQLRDRSAKAKRKAEDDLRGGGTKRSASEAPEAAPFPSSNPSKTTMKYPNGALRMTRTSGRGQNKNCVNLPDVIHKEYLISACVFSFFIADNKLYDHLPLSHSSDAVPIYIGRDATQDPMIGAACKRTGIDLKGSLSKKQFQSIKPTLGEMYKEQYGKNYHAFYAWSPGSSHSKILVLVYPDFLRLVITSCNMMNIDTIGGDNHWYNHDLPKRSSRVTPEPASFEADFLEHLRALDTPEAFLNSIQGMYDYSQVKVHLVTSVPGVCAGPRAEKHGLLRLRRVIRSLDLKLSKLEKTELRLEICAASIGKLSARWLADFYDCALGKAIVGIGDEESDVPYLKLFFPSVGDVKSADEDAQKGASNIGCHLRPWDSAPTEVKNIFHHYKSKDPGRLFHQKFILAYNPQDKRAPPYYVYIGSANFSSAAWGQLDEDLKKNRATYNTKLIKTSNFECGVVIPGSLIGGLLEPGTESWQAGIVPYVQMTSRYDLPKDRAWNSPEWVTEKNYRENYQGTSFSSR